MKRRRIALVSVAAAGCLVLAGWQLRWLGNEAQPEAEVHSYLAARSPVAVDVQQCEHVEHDSYFMIYACTISSQTRLELQGDDLPSGESTYCFEVPRAHAWPEGSDEDPGPIALHGIEGQSCIDRALSGELEEAK